MTKFYFGVNNLSFYFGVNRNFLSLRSSVASFKSQTTRVSEKSIVLPFFPYTSIRDQIWPCHKIGQDQPRVIIWKYLIVLEHLMQHTKFKDHRPFGSEGEDFLRFCHIWASGLLGHVTWTVWTNFCSPISWRLHMKFGLNRPSGFRGEVWKYWHTHTHTYTQTNDSGLPIL